MKVTILLLALAVVAVQLASAAVKFRSCGPSKITSVSFEGTKNDPTPTFKKGATYTTKVEYIAAASHSTVATTWYAILNGAHVKWEGVRLRSGCEATQPSCPVAAGNKYTYVEKLTVPTDAPQMRTVIKIVQTGDGNADHMCVMLSMQIK